jgi:putative PIN family toxin of toxin-antitoxin system
MIRIVADTNVFISALMFDGLPARFLDLAFAGSFVLVTSPVLLDELDDKLRTKFRVSFEDADQVRSRLERVSEQVSTSPTLSVVEDDPDDDRVLECAIAGRADYIVTGDRHLLNLVSYEQIPILTVREFMDRQRTIKSPASV